VSEAFLAALTTSEISSLGYSLPVCHKKKSVHQLLIPLFVPFLMWQLRLLYLNIPGCSLDCSLMILRYIDASFNMFCLLYHYTCTLL